MRANGFNITSSSGSVSYPRTPAVHTQASFPHRRYDPVCALVYLVLIPFAAGWFWRAIYLLLRALVRAL